MPTQARRLPVTLRVFAGSLLATGCVWAAQPPAAPSSASAPAATPAADLPKAEKVLERYIEATGGRAAYEKITSRDVTGRFEMAAMNISAPVHVISKAPNMFRLTIESPTIGKIDSGTNGTIAWDMNSMTGPRVLEGVERDQMLRTAIFNADLHPEVMFDKMETQALEPVDGKDCYKVLLTPKSGPTSTNWYEKESGLLVKSTTKQQSQMGEMNAETLYQDYKAVDGVTQAHKLVVRVMGMEQQLIFDKIAQNIELPAESFDPPEEVKKLSAAPKPEPKPVVDPAPKDNPPK